MRTAPLLRWRAANQPAPDRGRERQPGIGIPDAPARVDDQQRLRNRVGGRLQQVNAFPVLDQRRNGLPELEKLFNLLRGRQRLVLPLEVQRADYPFGSAIKGMRANAKSPAGWTTFLFTSGCLCASATMIGFFVRTT